MEVRIVLDEDYIFCELNGVPRFLEPQELYDLVNNFKRLRKKILIRTWKGIIRVQKVTLSEPEDGYLERIEYKDGTLIYIQGEYIRKFK